MLTASLDLMQGKKYLNSSTPTNSLIGRDKELIEIKTFVSEHKAEKNGGVLFITGPPGTGKTTSMDFVFAKGDQVMKFNCMDMTIQQIYKKIGDSLDVVWKGKKKVKEVKDCLEKELTIEGNMM